MPVIFSTAEGSDHLATLRRLVGARWIALGLMAGLTLLVPPILAISLPQVPLFAIIGTTAIGSEAS